MQTKTPPSSYFICAQATEEHLLYWLLTSEKALLLVAKDLKEDLFYDPKCKAIAKAIIQLLEEEEQVNWQTVVARLNAQPYQNATMADVAQIIAIPGSSTAPLLSLMKTLDMYRKCRAMVKLSQILWMTGTKDPQISTQEQEIEMMLQQFDEIRLGFEKTFEPLDEALEKNRQTIADNQHAETRHTGLLTGFKLIDNMGGLPIGMSVLAAKSSHGKSAMALNWAVNAAKQGMKVAFFSLEMQSEELSARILSMETRDMQALVSANAIMRMPLSQEQIHSTDMAITRLRESGCAKNILLNVDLSSAFTRMELQIKQLVSQDGVKAIFIDYLQIVEMARKNGSTKEEVIGAIAHKLHALAVKMQIYIVVLSQVNRTVQGEPSMFQLRDSGQIAEAADSVAILWRPEQEPIPTTYNEPHKDWPTAGTAILKLEKFRNGPTGEDLIKYTPRLTYYEDLSPEELALRMHQPGKQDELFTPETFE